MALAGWVALLAFALLCVPCACVAAGLACYLGAGGLSGGGGSALGCDLEVGDGGAPDPGGARADVATLIRRVEALCGAVQQQQQHHHSHQEQALGGGHHHHAVLAGGGAAAAAASKPAARRSFQP